MSEIPASWSEAPLGDVLTLGYGKACPESQRTPGAPFPVVSSAGEMARCKTPIVKEDCIVIGRKGNVGQAHLVRGGCWPTDTTYFVRIPAGLDGAFLLRELESLNLRALDSSSTTPSLRRPDLEAVRLRVAPAGEQWRIVEALEERLSQLDVAASDLSATVRKLVATRDRLLAEFLAQVGERTAAIGDLADVGSGATPLKSERAYYDGGTVPWVTSADLNAGLVTTARQHITELALEKTSVKVWPAGTLLVAMYGEGQTRGRCALLDIAATTNQACAAIVLRDNSPVTSDFLHMFLDASYVRTRRLSAGGVQPNLSLGLIRSIEVPVRSRDAQRDLVQVTRAALKQVELTRKGLSRLIARCTMLRRSLLTAAFTGQLVEQDPTDEPADLLLKRIAEERALMAPTARRRRTRTVTATGPATTLEESA